MIAKIFTFKHGEPTDVRFASSDDHDVIVLIPSIADLENIRKSLDMFQSGQAMMFVSPGDAQRHQQKLQRVLQTGLQDYVSKVDARVRKRQELFRGAVLLGEDGEAKS